jgi:hypothetical protein
MDQSFSCKLSLAVFAGIARVAALALLLISVSFAQTTSFPATDPGTLVRRAVAERLAENAAHRPLRYLLHKQDERHNIIQDIIETAQGDVALVVASNGAPLSPAAHQAQIERLHTLAADPALQEHRRKREQEDLDRVNKLLRLLPDAFIYTYAGTETCNVASTPDVHIPGQPIPPQPAAQQASQVCYRLTFTPNPTFNPPDIGSDILRGMAGDLWMEKSQDRLVRLNAHLIASVDFGWGILGRLDKGGTVFLEQSDVDGGEWELTRMKLNLTGKALLVKSLNYQMTEEMAHFSPVPPNLDYREAIKMLLASQPPAQ